MRARGEGQPALCMQARDAAPPRARSRARERPPPGRACSRAREAEAAARASVVLQQPGGPCSSTPRGGARPRRANAPACASGHSTAWRRRALTAARPPMSSQAAAGSSASQPRVMDGVMRASAAAKSAARTRPPGARARSPARQRGARDQASEACGTERLSSHMVSERWAPALLRDGHEQPQSPPGCSAALAGRLLASGAAPRPPGACNGASAPGGAQRRAPRRHARRLQTAHRRRAAPAAPGAPASAGPASAAPCCRPSAAGCRPAAAAAPASARMAASRHSAPRSAPE
jgi:translation initiation factor IF-2